MKKVLAIILAITMLFSMASVVAYAEEGTTNDGIISDIIDGDVGNDEEIDDGYYSLLEFFSELFENINRLLQYILVVFFPDSAAPEIA